MLSVIPVRDSQLIALELAFISTGSVMKLNNVVLAKRIMPKMSRPGKMLMVSTPARSTHCTMFDAKFTTGTRAERILRGA